MVVGLSIGSRCSNSDRIIALEMILLCISIVNKKR